MRQGQQHRRGRNRNSSNNRKGQNPLTRNFESNGPDVKIRGTPAHVAEKYMSLARDALSSGDPVLAENYLQHAEHYNRIILAYREQQAPLGDQPSANGNGRGRDASNGGEEYGDDGDEGAADEPPRIIQPDDPQPSVSSKSENARSDKPEGRRQRSPRNSGANGRAREGRSGGDSGEGGERRAPRERRRERQRFGDSDQQPDFLRRPVRRRQNEEASEGLEQDDQSASREPVELGGEQQE